MSKRVYSQKPNRREPTVRHTDVQALGAKHIASRRGNSKRAIKRFFRLQSFPPKAAKKLPKEKPRTALRLSDLMAFVEAGRRRVDDQRQEHMRTLRRAGRDGK